MAGKKVDWKSFRTKINGLLDKMGNEVIIEVTEESKRSSTGKKLPSLVTRYRGLAVMTPYSSEFYSKSESIIKAGDVKFICQMEDETFEPSEKKDEKIIFVGKVYTIVNVEIIQPAETGIVFNIQARRVN